MGCCFSRKEITEIDNTVIPNNPLVAKFDARKIKNLAFSGGSANGIVYVGVYKRLKELAIVDSLEGVAGTSVGAIFATLTALNVSYDYMKQIVIDLDTTKLLDDSWGVMTDLERLNDKLGYCPGNYLREWIEDRLHELTNIKQITFKQLYNITKRNLRIIVWNENKVQCEFWDAESQPNMAVSFAIRTSASLPFIFVPQRYNGCIYVDGGVGNTYPLNAFPDNGTTYGVMVMDPIDTLDPALVTEQKVESLTDHMMAIYTSMTVNTFRLNHHHDNWNERTIAIKGAGKKIWDFSFTEDEKRLLIKQAYQDTLIYL